MPTLFNDQISKVFRVNNGDTPTAQLELIRSNFTRQSERMGEISDYLSRLTEECGETCQLANEAGERVYTTYAQPVVDEAYSLANSNYQWGSIAPSALSSMERALLENGCQIMIDDEHGHASLDWNDSPIGPILDQEIRYGAGSLTLSTGVPSNVLFLTVKDYITGESASWPIGYRASRHLDYCQYLNGSIRNRWFYGYSLIMNNPDLDTVVFGSGPLLNWANLAHVQDLASGYTMDNIEQMFYESTITLSEYADGCTAALNDYYSGTTDTVTRYLGMLSSRASSSSGLLGDLYAQMGSLSLSTDGTAGFGSCLCQLCEDIMNAEISEPTPDSPTFVKFSRKSFGAAAFSLAMVNWSSVAQTAGEIVGGIIGLAFGPVGLAVAPIVKGISSIFATILNRDHALYNASVISDSTNNLLDNVIFRGKFTKEYVPTSVLDTLDSYGSFSILLPHICVDYLNLDGDHFGVEVFPRIIAMAPFESNGCVLTPDHDDGDYESGTTYNFAAPGGIQRFNSVLTNCIQLPPMTSDEWDNLWETYSFANHLSNPDPDLPDSIIRKAAMWSTSRFWFDLEYSVAAGHKADGLFMLYSKLPPNFNDHWSASTLADEIEYELKEEYSETTAAVAALLLCRMGAVDADTGSPLLLELGDASSVSWETLAVAAKYLNRYISENAALLADISTWFVGLVGISLYLEDSPLTKYNTVNGTLGSDTLHTIPMDSMVAYASVGNRYGFKGAMLGTSVYYAAVAMAIAAATAVIAVTTFKIVRSGKIRRKAVQREAELQQAKLALSKNPSDKKLQKTVLKAQKKNNKAQKKLMALNGKAGSDSPTDTDPGYTIQDVLIAMMPSYLQQEKEEESGEPAD